MRVLADAEVQLATLGLVGRLDAVVLQDGACVRREVGPTGEQPRHDIGEGLEHLAARDAGGHLLAGLPRGEGVSPAREPAAVEDRVERGSIADVGLDALQPGLALVAPSRARGAVEVDDIVRHVEGLVGQAHDGLGRRDVLVLERVAVGGGIVGLRGGGVGDVAPQDHERRPRPPRRPRREGPASIASRSSAASPRFWTCQP